MHNTASILINCIVVDDEPMAREVIKRYIAQVPNLHMNAEFGNAIDAAIFLQANKVELIFLDIKMPQLSGTEFVKTLRNAPKIIFTTAYKQYAFEGFELDVIDYLLKPIRFDRFLKAVNKAYPQQDQKETIAVEKNSNELKAPTSFIYLKVDRKMIKVLLCDILFIESDKDFIKVFTAGGIIITRQTIASVEAMLLDSDFVRIHRSYIVSLQKIKSFTHETVEVGKQELPIGKLYRNSFLKLQGV